jgi:hypothetical protein
MSAKPLPDGAAWFAIRKGDILVPVVGFGREDDGSSRVTVTNARGTFVGKALHAYPTREACEVAIAAHRIVRVRTLGNVAIDRAKQNLALRIVDERNLRIYQRAWLKREQTRLRREAREAAQIVANARRQLAEVKENAVVEERRVREAYDALRFEELSKKNKQRIAERKKR